MPADPFELSRSLDPCSEMLSLLGKILVLYVQRIDEAHMDGARLDDAGAQAAAFGLSRKIRQKRILIPSTGSDLG